MCPGRGAGFCSTPLRSETSRPGGTCGSTTKRRREGDKKVSKRKENEQKKTRDAIGLDGRQRGPAAAQRSTPHHTARATRRNANALAAPVHLSLAHFAAVVVAVQEVVHAEAVWLSVDKLAFVDNAVGCVG